MSQYDAAMFLLNKEYMKAELQGMDPFGCLMYASEKLGAQYGNNPPGDVVSALTDFTTQKMAEMGGDGGTITDYDGGHTDTTAYRVGPTYGRTTVSAPVTFGRTSPRQSWSPSQDSSDWVFEDISLDDMFGPSEPAQPTLVGRAKPVNLAQRPSNYVAVPPATISQKAIALAFPGRLLSTFQAAPWAAPVHSMKTQDIVSTGAPAVTQGVDSSVGVGKVLLGAAIFAGIAYVLYESSKGTG